MANTPYEAHTTIQAIINANPSVISVLLNHRMGCVGCTMAGFHTLEDAAKNHHIDLESLTQQLLESATPCLRNASAYDPLRGEMAPQHHYIPNLDQLVDTIPSDSIVSKTIVREDGLKAILFGFDAGQELSQHTASVPAMIQILSGECIITLGTESFNASSGSWAYMPANLPHSIMARTPVRMLLLMLQKND